MFYYLKQNGVHEKNKASFVESSYEHNIFFFQSTYKAGFQKLKHLILLIYSCGTLYKGISQQLTADSLNMWLFLAAVLQRIIYLRLTNSYFKSKILTKKIKSFHSKQAQKCPSDHKFHAHFSRTAEWNFNQKLIDN